MDASVRASSCVRTHTHANGCILAVWESGDARRLKKGAICRAMADTPCAWEYQWGYTYTHMHTPLSLSDTFFVPRAGFFTVTSSCLRAYDAAPSLWSVNPKPPSRSPFGVRHLASCGARRFLFQIFSISMKGETRVDWPVYEWNGAISHAEVVKQYISRYRAQYNIYWMIRKVFYKCVLSARNSLTNLNIPSYNGKNNLIFN